MGYIDENLLPGERVILKANLHWAVLVGPLLTFIFGCILASLFAGSNSNARTNSASAGSSLLILCIAFPIILAGMASAAKGIMDLLSTEFAITDKRIIAKTGLIRRRSLELLLNKIESIGVNQTIIGRIFNFGTIVVVGTGGTREGFPIISKPMEFRKRVNAQIAEASNTAPLPR